MIVLQISRSLLASLHVAVLMGTLLIQRSAFAVAADEPTFSIPAVAEEQFDQDNMARELAGQQATLARYDAQRGDQKAALNRLEQALKLAAQVQGIRKRTVALVTIAKVQAEVRDTAGALKTVSIIQSLTERDSTLRTIAFDRAKAGDVENAKLFANAIQDTSKKIDASSYIETLQSVKPLGY